MSCSSSLSGPPEPVGASKGATFDSNETSRVTSGTESGEQPTPVPNDNPAVWDLVVADMKARDRLGERRYGTRLQAHNGRDSLRDLYEEILDSAVYARTLLYERDGK